jgi:hypothetical protein
VLGEFGGLGLPLDGHLWVAQNNWGYRTFKDRHALETAYADLMNGLRCLRALGLCAAVYTQTTDCEVEVNGLLTYDRAIIKVPPEIASPAHKMLYGPLPTIEPLVPTAQTSPQTWSYTLHTPGADWNQPVFDDSSWSTGQAGFGTTGTPGALVHSHWSTNDIWLRHAFELDSRALKLPHVMIHHDEDAEVYLNGKMLLKLNGHTTGYSVIPLKQEASLNFKPGRNVLAVHCHQTKGGQYIDVGLLDLIEKAKP